MAIPLGSLPVFMRIGDSPEEFEIGSLEAEGEISRDGHGNMTVDVKRPTLGEFFRAAAVAADAEEAANGL